MDVAWSTTYSTTHQTHIYKYTWEIVLTTFHLLKDGDYVGIFKKPDMFKKLGIFKKLGMLEEK